MEIWVPFLSALVGGVLALVGAWLAQRMAKRREFELDERRSQRAREDATRVQVRELFLEAAEFAQAFDSRLTSYEDPFARGRRSAETVHRDLLAARLRTLNYPLMMRAWNALVLTEGYVQSTIDLGEFEIDQASGQPMLDSGEFYMVGGHVAVEAVMLAATATLGPDEYLGLFAPLATALAAQVEASFDYVRSSDSTSRRASEQEAARQLGTVLEISRQFASAPPANSETVRETVAAIEAAGRHG